MSMLERVRLTNVDLRPKLLLAFVLIALMVGLTGAVGYLAVGAVDADAHTIATDAEEVDAAMELALGVERQQIAVQTAMLGGPDARDSFREAQSSITDWSETLEGHDLSGERRRAFDEFTRAHEEYTAIASELFDAVEAGEMETANSRLAALEELEMELRGAAHTIESGANDELATAVTSADSTTGVAQTAVIGLTIVAFVAAIAIGLFVAGRIMPPIVQLSETARAMSDGDLSTEIDDHPEADEIGRMVGAFREMQANLRGVFDQIGTASNGLKRGDLGWEFETSYPGRYGETIDDLEDGATELAGSFQAIRDVSAGLEAGRLEHDVDTARPGEYGVVLGDLATGTARLSESFTQISTASEQLKAGRLDQDLETEYPGTYGTVLADFQEGIDRLAVSVERVQQIADQVARSSDSVSNTTAEIEEASEEVAESVEEISHGADTQSENLQEVAGEMNDMSATVEEIASSAEEVASTAKTAVERGDTGREHAGDATEQLRSIETKADDTAAQVRTLDEKMTEIGEIVTMITDIAEQTNMLALNASIEAARAGEAGEGFGVVATEIKSLAEEAAQATADIEEQIEAVQTTTTATVDGMDEMQARVERGSGTIEDAIEMFDEIADAVGDAESGIREISDATDDQAASSEEVVAMVDDVSSVSQQTAAEASTVSAATEEQTASLADAAGTVQHLSELADDLHEQVSAFDTGTDRSAASGGPESVSADGGRERRGSEQEGRTDASQ